MKTVTVLGSCRIHHPIRHLDAVGLVRTDNTGTRGYIHSLGEAVQLISCPQGRERLDPATRLFTEPACLADIDGGAATPHEDTDLFIVEVSSIKEFILGAQYIQMNMLQKFLKDLDAHAYFVMLCDLMRAKKGAFVKLPTLCDNMGETPRSIFMSLSGIILTFDLLVWRLKALRALLQKPVLLVTHIAAPGTEGDMLAAFANRLEGIAMLREAGCRLGIPVAEPGEFVAAHGTDKAMRNSYHYQEDFLPQLGHWLYTRFIRDM